LPTAERTDSAEQRDMCFWDGQPSSELGFHVIFVPIRHECYGRRGRPLPLDSRVCSKGASCRIPESDTSCPRPPGSRGSPCAEATRTGSYHTDRRGGNFCGCNFPDWFDTELSTAARARPRSSTVSGLTRPGSMGDPIGYASGRSCNRQKERQKGGKGME
jgi:hypothetical protein